MHRSPAGFVFVFATLMIAAALSGETRGGSADPVVIEFGDRVVTRAEVEHRFQIAIRLLARRQGISLTDQDPSVIAALRDQYLDKYASELALLQEAGRRQLAVSPARVDEALSKLFASEDDENEFLDDAPLNDGGHELLRGVVRDEQTIELLTEVMLEEIQIPPGDVITMHHDVKDRLATPEEFCVRHIQTDSPDAASDIREELEQGADFANLAARRSTDTASADTGGDLGCFERSHSASLSEFEDAVFSAEEGELVGPVASRHGYHMLVVYEHKMPRAPTLNEAYAQIERELALEQLPERLQALVSDSGISVRPGTFRISTD